MSDNQPREYDVVLGGDSQAPVDGVVLGGIEGVKRRLANPDIKVKIAGLYQALNYGEAGLDVIIKVLQTEKNLLRATAYRILKQSQEASAMKTLQGCSDYHFFYCISTLKEHQSRLNSVCITPDGENLISSSEDSVIIWNWQNNQFRKIFTSQVDLSNYDNESINFICVNYIRENIYIRSKWGIIQELSLQNPNIKYKLNKKEMGLHHSLIVDKSGNILFIGNDKGSIKVWDTTEQKRKYLLRGHTKPIFSLAVYGKFLFSGSGDYTIKIWDWEAKKKLIRTLEGHSFWITALCLNPDGTILFSGGGDRYIKIWDWQKGELIGTLEGHSYGVSSLAISPDGKTLISGSNDKTIKVWNWKTGKLLATLKGHSAEVNSIVLSPDGKYLFSGSHDKTVKVWGL